MRNAALSLLALSFASSIFAAGRDVTSPTFGASPLPVAAPSVASLGDRFLTVWDAYGRLYESLADRDGKLLTPIAPSLTNVPGAAVVVPIADHYVVISWGYQRTTLIALNADGSLRVTLPDPPIPTPAGLPPKRRAAGR